jgi:class 3 adenylate cyclase
LFSISSSEEKERAYFLKSEKDNKMITALKIIRVFRLVRIVKLYKAAIYIQRNREKKKQLEKLKQLRLLKQEREREKELLRQKAKEENKANLENSPQKKSFIGRMNTKFMTTINHKLNVGNENNFIKKKSGELNSSSNNESKDNKTGIRESKADIEPQIQAEIQELSYDDLPAESKISRTVSDTITKKIIIIILLLLFLSPMTDNDVFSDDSYFSYLCLCKLVNNFNVLYPIDSPEVQKFIDYGVANNKYKADSVPILQINYLNATVWRNSTYNESDYRVNEQGSAFASGGFTVVVFSNKEMLVLSSIVSIFRTIFTIGCLYYMAVVLEKDSGTLVLKPLQIMINVVELVSQDPVNSRNLEIMRNIIGKSIKKISKRDSTIKAENQLENSTYEIKIIQLAILRISTLLAIGFGEAGGEILKENLGTRKELNPMLPGKKKNALFGFCDIRGFADINIALQEKTMIFVNEIAEIVHSSVDIYGGAANKNIGDAFLVVWKFDNNKVDEAPLTINQVADKALLGFLRTIMKVNKDSKLRMYAEMEEIKNSKTIKKPFVISMGFGLHVGWAIEGPIGSMYKMDCSYLSPNVNIAARLEAATRQYGVNLLISGEVYDNLSPCLKDICRKIDIVKVKGSNKPLHIYTVDVNLENLKVGKKKKQMTMAEKRKCYTYKKNNLSSKENFAEHVLNKRSFKALLFDDRGSVFHDKFRKGFKHYIDGDWESAYRELRFADFIVDSTDGPTKVLLNFIEENDIKKPEGWNGVHVLTSK